MTFDPFAPGNALWLWLGLGAVLLSLEIVLPGVFLLWFGLAAVLVGLTVWLLPMGMLAQIALFAGLSVLLLVLARQMLSYGVTVSDPERMNLRGQRYVGQVYLVEEAIVNGRGKVRVGDTLWSAEGQDAAAGGKVRVLSVRGTVLEVEPA